MGGRDKAVDAKITYTNEDGHRVEVLFSQVLLEIGVEYGVSSSVMGLSPDSNPRDIEITVIESDKAEGTL